MPTSAEDVLAQLREFFNELGEWIPGVVGWFQEMVLQWPEAKHERIFDLADAYRTASELYSDHLENLQDYLRDLDVWQGDGAAQVARDQLQAYFEETAAMAKAVGAMQQMVHGKAIEIEAAKYMAIINLVMIGIALVQLLLTFWTGIGAAVGAAQMTAGGVTIRAVMHQLLIRLWQQTIREGVRRFIAGGLRGVGMAALRGGLIYAGFTAVTRGGIMLVQALEGHDPFTEGWAGRFGMEVLDSFIAGAIGGPLMFGIQSRLVGALAFGAGQTADNVLQILRDRALDRVHLTEWAQRNGLYSGMTWGDVLNAVTPAALLGEIISDFDIRARGGQLSADLANAQVRLGDVDLFGTADAPAAVTSPAALPDPRLQAVGAPSTSSSAGTSSGVRPTTSTGTSTVGASTPSTSSSSTSASSSSSSSSGGSATSGGRGGGTSTRSVDGPTTTGDGSRPVISESGTPPPGSSPSVDATPAEQARVFARPDAPPPAMPDAPPPSSPDAPPPVRPDVPPPVTSDVAPPSSPDAPAPSNPDLPPATRPDGPSLVDSHAGPDGPSLVDGSARPDDPSLVDRRSGSDRPSLVDGSARPDGPSLVDGVAPADGVLPADGSGRSTVDDPGTANPPVGSATPGDVSTARPPAEGDSAGPRREEPNWSDWKRRAEIRFEQHYGQAIAQHLGTQDGSAGPAPQRGPRLTPELVQRALDARPDTLNPYGSRLKTYVEQHFTQLDGAGNRRPMDSAGIDATLRELRGDADGATRGPREPAPPPETPATPSRPSPVPVGPDVPPADLPAHPQELAPSANFPPHLTRTAAELPQHVHDLIDQARTRLLDRYPEHVVAQRIADLEAVGDVANALQDAANRYRGTGDLGDTVQRVRDLSDAVNQYSDRYKGWQDFDNRGRVTDPGWRDFDGVDPLNSVEMAHRMVDIDPTTLHFDPIAQAIAVAKIGEVLGPQFEAHAMETLARTVPMDMDSVRALLPADAISPEIEHLVAAGGRGFYDPVTGWTFINPHIGTGASPLSAFAASLVHESMHGLQPNAKLLWDALGDLPPDRANQARALLTFEREFQAFAVQQEFLRGLAGHRSPDPTGDLRIPNVHGYRELASLSPEGLRNLVLDRYIPAALRHSLDMDTILTRYPELRPDNIIAQARLAIVDTLHPVPGQPQHGGLIGPVHRHVDTGYGIDIDAIRSADTAIPRDGPTPFEFERGPSLASLEENPGADLPVLGVDDVTFRTATPVVPADPPPLTPDRVRAMLADPATPPQITQWVSEYLTVPAEDGTVVPKSAAQIDATLAALRQSGAAGMLGSTVAGRPDPPVAGQLHLLGFAGSFGGHALPGLPERLSTALGGIGDQVALRIPQVSTVELSPGVRVFGAPAIPGVTGHLSPLLRADGLPGDVDVLVGYNDTAGIADVRRDAYPDARVVQVLDMVPTDAEHLRLLGQADLVVAVGPEVAHNIRALLDGLALDNPPPVHELTPGFEAKPPPPPGPPQAGYRLLVADASASDLDQAVSVVRELRDRGLDVRLTVTMRDLDPGQLANRQLLLSTMVGAEVDLLPVPDDPGSLTGQLHDADLVITFDSGHGYPPSFMAAAEHGVPALVGDGTGAGRLLADPDRVPPELGDPAVVRGDWADHVHNTLTDLAGQRDRALALRGHLTTQYGVGHTAATLHNAIHALGDRVAHVDDAAWNGVLDPREVVLRNAAAAPETGGRMRVMTTCPEWYSTRGGVPTANRELTQAFAEAGQHVYSRVSIVDPTSPTMTALDMPQGPQVVGTHTVWGVVDADGHPDIRAFMMMLDGLPPHIDVVIGHSRFSGGAAAWLVEHVYPEAQYVHVLHTSPEVLDALRADPAQGLRHAETERALMAVADLVAGVGPLLAQDAARLAGLAVPGDPPPVHEITSDMPANPIDPPARPVDRQGFDLVVQGRADDPLKGFGFTAMVVAELRAHGVDVRLTVRGASSPDVAHDLAADWSAVAGNPVEVRTFSPNPADLLNDLHQADLVLMPSLHEGFGLVASEAARAGVPVLVGEGTGAGLFFGDRRYVPTDLGAAATVHDGITVQSLRETLRTVTGPDGTITRGDLDSVLSTIAAQRVAAWSTHIEQVLADLPNHRERALALRDYLDHEFPDGHAARALLAALRGEDPGRPVAPEPTSPTAPGGAPDAVQHQGVADDALHHQQQIDGIGPRVSMDISNVHAVAAKYSIDIDDVKVVLRKDRIGYEGSTGPDGTVTLTRDAFQNEATLARTLAHERFHLGQIRSGREYPQNKTEALAWENEAYTYEDHWWNNHRLNQPHQGNS